MIKKTVILLFALAGFVMTSGVEMKAQVSATSKKTSSVSASAPVRELCGIINELAETLQTGDMAAANNIQKKLNELDALDVNEQELTPADKDLLKKTLNSFLQVGIKATLKQQGVNYDTLDASKKSQIDAMLVQALETINTSIDKSRTLKEAGQILQSLN